MPHLKAVLLDAITLPGHLFYNCSRFICSHRSECPLSSIEVIYLLLNPNSALSHLSTLVIELSLTVSGARKKQFRMSQRLFPPPVGFGEL